MADVTRDPARRPEPKSEAVAGALRQRQKELRRTQMRRNRAETGRTVWSPQALLYRKKRKLRHELTLSSRETPFELAQKSDTVRHGDDDAAVL